MATTNKGWTDFADADAIDQDLFDVIFVDIDTSLFGSGTTGNEPGSPDTGDTFYDTTLSAFKKYNGSKWIEILSDRGVQIVVFDPLSSVSTGDGKFYFHVDARIGGRNLVDVHAEVITAGTTNTLDIQIANVTQSADMLTTKLTVDSGETGSDTAATAAVIDTGIDDVAENDILRIDIDAVQTTVPKGLIVTLGFGV